MKILSKSIKNVLKKSDFKDVAVLSLGVLAGQIINIICMPIATRLYSVESFGILSTIVKWTPSSRQLFYKFKVH